MSRLTSLVKEAARWTGFDIVRTRRRHARRRSGRT